MHFVDVCRKYYLVRFTIIVSELKKNIFFISNLQHLNEENRHDLFYDLINANKKYKTLLGIK